MQDENVRNAIYCFKNIPYIYSLIDNRSDTCCYFKVSLVIEAAFITKTLFFSLFLNHLNVLLNNAGSVFGCSVLF